MAKVENKELTDLEIELIGAEEDFVADFQFMLHRVMVESGVSRSELADRLGVSKARVTQVLKSEANPTLRTAARFFHALGEDLTVTCGAWETVNNRAGDLQVHWSSPDVSQRLFVPQTRSGDRLNAISLKVFSAYDIFDGCTNDNERTFDRATVGNVVAEKEVA